MSRLASREVLNDLCLVCYKGSHWVKIGRKAQDLLSLHLRKIDEIFITV